MINSIYSLQSTTKVIKDTEILDPGMYDIHFFHIQDLEMLSIFWECSACENGSAPKIQGSRWQQ